VFADPDDCLAIVLAIKAGITIEFIATIGGNGSEVSALASARYLARNIPVHPGETSCGSGMVNAYRDATARGSVTILALGPLTNIATVLRCDPAVASKITEVVFVGGRRPGQRLIANPDWMFNIPLRDLNVEVDPEAVRILLASNIRIRLVPFEAGNAVPMRVWNRQFSDSGLSPVVLARLRDWSVLSSSFWGTDGVLPFDPVAVATILWPDLFWCGQVRATMNAENHLTVIPDPSPRIRYCLPREPGLVRAHLLGLLR
jgi:pyrimidine-specific ribonucleoside hydrolase